MTFQLSSYGNITISYNCISVPSPNGTTLPTIWFESVVEHGIVDWLGVQTALALNGRNSCSYDPPNFGWSSRLSSNASYDIDVSLYLMQAIGRANEDKVLVGLDVGNEMAVKHAIANPANTKAVVLLDPAPLEIEALVQRGTSNWTLGQLQVAHSKNMANQISYFRDNLMFFMMT